MGFWSASTKGSSTKYDHFMRVCMNKNEENEKFLPLEISIITLVKGPSTKYDHFMRVCMDN